MPEENTNTQSANTAEVNTQETQSQSSEQAAAERTFTQADVDRMIQDRLTRERKQHAQDIEKARTEARTEAEELARMTAEQREQREREKAEKAAKDRERELNKREAEISRRELQAQAVDTLASRDLPKALAPLLDYTSAETVSASMDTVEKAFRDAVQAAVDTRLKASGVTLPTPGNRPDYSKMTDADYYASVLKKN